MTLRRRNQMTNILGRRAFLFWAVRIFWLWPHLSTTLPSYLSHVGPGGPHSLFHQVGPGSGLERTSIGPQPSLFRFISPRRHLHIFSSFVFSSPSRFSLSLSLCNVKNRVLRGFWWGCLLMEDIKKGSLPSALKIVLDRVFFVWRDVTPCFRSCLKTN